MTRQVVENLKIQLLKQGQKVFLKKDMADKAYLILNGQLSFYDTRKHNEINCCTPYPDTIQNEPISTHGNHSALGDS